MRASAHRAIGALGLRPLGRGAAGTVTGGHLVQGLHARVKTWWLTSRRSAASAPPGRVTPVMGPHLVLPGHRLGLCPAACSFEILLGESWWFRFENIYFRPWQPSYILLRGNTFCVVKKKKKVRFAGKR